MKSYRLKEGMALTGISSLDVVDILGKVQFIRDCDYIMPIDSAEKNTISFCYHRKDAGVVVYESNASVVIADIRSIDLFMCQDDKQIILVDDVKLQFAEMLYCVVESMSQTRQLVDISCGEVGPNVFAQGDVTIGSDVTLMGNIYLFDGTIIGDGVTIMPGVVIGGAGFGHAKDGDIYIPFPHIGGVIIGSGVTIGSNTCIDKGTLGNTIIGDNCHIDNLVHIAHNVVMESGCMVIANSMIAGSCYLREGVHISPSTSVLQGTTIGNGSFTGMGSCVVKDVDKNTLVYGVPAKAHGKAPEDY